MCWQIQHDLGDGHEGPCQGRYIFDECVSAAEVSAHVRFFAAQKNSVEVNMGSKKDLYTS